jgi:hypothetical protein
MTAGGALVENHQADGCAHEDDRRPGGEPGEHVGCSAWAEGSLRALAAKSASEIGRPALLNEDDPDQEKAHNYMHKDDEPEENLHSVNCFLTWRFQKRAMLPGTPDEDFIGAEEGT